MSQTVDELREELRRGRQHESPSIASESLNGTSSDTEGISRGNNRPEQSIFVDLPGSSAEDDTVDDSYNGVERSVDEKPLRVRSTDRRLSQNSSSSSDSAKAVRGTTRRAGKLEADDPIPIRSKEPKTRRTSRTLVQEHTSEKVNNDKTSIIKTKESKSIQRGKETGKAGNDVSERTGEEQKPKFTLPNFKEGSTLSISEAKALEGPLLAALESDFYYLDQYIWYRTQDTTQAPIWSDMDNEDLEVLTKILLKRGQKSPATAATVRAIVNGSTYIDVGMLMVPRFMRTVQVLKAAPKRERPSLFERKRMAAHM